MRLARKTRADYVSFAVDANDTGKFPHTNFDNRAGSRYFRSELAHTQTGKGDDIFFFLKKKKARNILAIRFRPVGS